MRRQIRPRRVGSSHDCREMIERRIMDVVSFDDGIERAVIADMAELYVVDVIGRAAHVRGNFGNIARRERR